MTTVNLYKYIDGSETIITPNKREESDTPYCYRLIADEGKVLKNGTDETPCVDTHTPSEWMEVPEEGEVTPEELASELEAML